MAQERNVNIHYDARPGSTGAKREHGWAGVFLTEADLCSQTEIPR